jgi:hypothetical protein
MTVAECCVDDADSAVNEREWNSTDHITLNVPS